MQDAVPGKHAQEAAATPDTKGAAPRPFLEMDSVRVALEAGEVGLWSWDVSSDAVTWSGHFAQIHGISDDAFDGNFASILRSIHPEDRQEFSSSLQESLRTGKPLRAQYRLNPAQDTAEDRWVEAIASVISENGTATRMAGICRDITDRQKLLREVRLRSRQQETVARIGELALTESDLQKLFDEIATSTAQLLDVEFVKILELVPGDAELLLRSGHGWREGTVGNAHESTGRHSQAGYVLASGGPVVVTDTRTETRFETPALLRDHGVNSGVSVPITGRDGRAYGVLGVHTARRRKFGENDVAFVVATANVIAGAIQRRQADQRHELMIRELRHRTGNLFAQLLALFSQTARTSRSVSDLSTKYEARVLALANAHRLITEGGWNATALKDLLRLLLAPYIDRVTLEGPDVFLDPDPSFALGSAVHELATNASKYGSLSKEDGRLELSWNVNRADNGMTLEFDWKERGGPVPKRPRREGFGTRLITMLIERQLSGSVGRTFGPNGLDTRLVLPLSHERWPGDAAPANESSAQQPADVH